eukprot:UN22838
MIKQEGRSKQTHQPRYSLNNNINNKENLNISRSLSVSSSVFEMQSSSRNNNNNHAEISRSLENSGVNKCRASSVQRSLDNRVDKKPVSWLSQQSNSRVLQNMSNNGTSRGRLGLGLLGKLDSMSNTVARFALKKGIAMQKSDSPFQDFKNSSRRNNISKPSYQSQKPYQSSKPYESYQSSKSHNYETSSSKTNNNNSQIKPKVHHAKSINNRNSLSGNRDSLSGSRNSVSSTDSSCRIIGENNHNNKQHTNKTNSYWGDAFTIHKNTKNKTKTEDKKSTNPNVFSTLQYNNYKFTRLDESKQRCKRKSFVYEI